MDPLEYERMAALEDHMWWYDALHRRLLDALDRFAPRPLVRLLDDGCGTGGFLRHAERRYPSTELHGIDAADVAIDRARARVPRAHIVRGDAGALPYADGGFDAIVSADVLCHRGVDVARALAEVRRCLAPGGVVVLNLPAYEWLRSAHDVQVHTARRFTTSGVRRDLEVAGLEVVRATHWNSFLFPAMALHRWLSRGGSSSDVHAYPPAVDRAFRAVLRVEHVVTARVGAPFGGSVFAVARRAD